MVIGSISEPPRASALGKFRGAAEESSSDAAVWLVMRELDDGSRADCRLAVQRR